MEIIKDNFFYSNSSLHLLHTSFQKIRKTRNSLTFTPNLNQMPHFSINKSNQNSLNHLNEESKDEQNNIRISRTNWQLTTYNQVIRQLKVRLRTESINKSEETKEPTQHHLNIYTNTKIISNFYEYTENCMRLIVKIKERKKSIENKVSFDFDMKNKKLAIFDLDETLVHCPNTQEKKGDYNLSVVLPGNKTVAISINIRPYWEEMIKKVSENYHIVVYTASHQSYADAVLNYIDPEKKYFQNRLYRRHCIQEEIDGQKFYVKDLAIFSGIDINDIVMIDNSVLSFAYHLDNGIPIIPFYDDKDDCEMKILSHYLLLIYNHQDLIKINRDKMQLYYFYDQAKEEYFRELEEDSNCNISINDNQAIIIP